MKRPFIRGLYKWALVYFGYLQDTILNKLTLFTGGASQGSQHRKLAAEAEGRVPRGGRQVRQEREGAAQVQGGDTRQGPQGGRRREAGADQEDRGSGDRQDGAGGEDCDAEAGKGKTFQIHFRFKPHLRGFFYM